VVEVTLNFNWKSTPKENARLKCRKIYTLQITILNAAKIYSILKLGLWVHYHSADRSSVITIIKLQDPRLRKFVHCWSKSQNPFTSTWL